MQICSGVFTTQYYFLLFGITLANMHPGWAIALSFIAAGWFGRRSFIRRDSTPTTYGNFWKLVQIPNNAVCLNVYPKQKMMYIQLSWKICPKLLQSQAYSCTSITIQDLSWKPEYYELIAKHIADAGQYCVSPNTYILCNGRHVQITERNMLHWWIHCDFLNTARAQALHILTNRIKFLFVNVQ